MILKVIGIASISLAITFGIALGLIASQRPAELSDTGGGLDFTRQVAATADPLPLLSVPLRDGFAAQVRHLPGPEGAPLLVLVHGSGWDGGQFDAIAPELAEVAEVIAPDLRGHGARPGRRWRNGRLPNPVPTCFRPRHQASATRAARLDRLHR